MKTAKLCGKLICNALTAVDEQAYKVVRKIFCSKIKVTVVPINPDHVTTVQAV